MKTKSSIYVDVTERPGEIGVCVQYAPGGPDDSASSALALYRILCVVVDQRPAPEAISGSVITGPRPGWRLALKPLGAKRAADGLRSVLGILTGDEMRTFRGLLRNAAKWAERPPMLTIIGLGSMPPGGIRHLLQRVLDAFGNEGGLPADLRPDVDTVLRLEEFIGDRALVDRPSLEALRAAPHVPPRGASLDFGDDRNVRWARRSSMWRMERKCPDVWEPCASTDDGAVLVVLP